MLYTLKKIWHWRVSKVRQKFHTASRKKWKKLRGALHVAAYMSQLPYEHAGYVNTGCSFTGSISSEPTAIIQITDSNFTVYTDAK